MKNIGSLIVFLALVPLVAMSGVSFRPGAWYESLAKPEWTPPNGLFPIAWSILYIMIGIAGWLVWRAAGWSAAIVAWGVGLFLNGLWSYLMFERHDIGLAFVDITALWLAIVAFIVLARRIDTRAAYLFVPYLLWVTFAAALNWTVWQMNA